MPPKFNERLDQAILDMLGFPHSQDSNEFDAFTLPAAMVALESVGVGSRAKYLHMAFDPEKWTNPDISLSYLKVGKKLYAGTGIHSSEHEVIEALRQAMGVGGDYVDIIHKSWEKSDHFQKLLDLNPAPAVQQKAHEALARCMSIAQAWKMEGQAPKAKGNRGSLRL